MRKRPEKTEQTKADIREAFWRMYETTPFDKITVSRLCEEAGYNRATFYDHFADTRDVLDSIEADVMVRALVSVESCLRSLDGGTLSKAAAMKDVVVFYERNRRYLMPLMGEQRDEAFIVALKESLKPLWRKYVIGPDSGRTDAEIDLILESALSGGLTMISRWMLDPGDVSPTQLAKLVYDVAIRDVSKRAQK